MSSEDVFVGNTLLQTKQREIEDKRRELKKLFDDNKTATGELKMSADQVQEVNRRNDELTELGKALDEAVKLYASEAKNREELERAREVGDRKHSQGEQKSDTPHSGMSSKSVGALFAEHKDVRGRAAGDIRNKTITIPGVDLKTLMSRTAGWDPEEVRNRPVLLSAQRPIQFVDMLPTRPISQAAVKYMEETTFTNNAAEVAEGATYGEAALQLTERSAIVEKVGVWLPVTDEQLEDQVGIEAYIDNRMTFMLRQRLDSQALSGNGSTPNLLGVTNKVGILTQAKGGDVVPDALYKAGTKIRVTGRAIPGAYVMHPNDWQDIRLLRTTDGIYIWGNPSEAGPERIWGQSIVLADSLTEGTAVQGDWMNFAEFSYLRGIEMKVTDSHSDYFINGKQAIRADVRCIAVWYRNTAFCTITGI